MASNLIKVPVHRKTIDCGSSLVNANGTSIARGQKAALVRSLDGLPLNNFIYGNYNVPYYNAADQCIRLSPKMASFAAENTQDNVFLLLRSRLLHGIQN